jgi:lipopolysaccharide assembly outer membrane protein LptD (OstA)
LWRRRNQSLIAWQRAALSFSFRRQMTRLRAIFLSAAFFAAISFGARAQINEVRDTTSDEVVFVSGEWVYNLKDGSLTFTNGATIRGNGAVLTAESGSINKETGECTADGRVRIQREDQLWAGEHIRYNFKTHQMIAEEFRTGKPPSFAQGMGLRGDLTNSVYHATNALITSDDVAHPAFKLRSSHMKIIPGKRIEATHATMYAGDVPIFYLPYFSRNLGERANNYNFTPGYDSSFGPFLLNDYTWFLNDQLDGKFHFDYREKRGPGVGPDFNFHLGRWGDGTIRYYYTHDDDAGTNVSNAQLPENRQRVYFSYQATPWTNLNVKALVRWQSDTDIVKDFFQGEYRNDPQPNTFFEQNKIWQNYSLDVLTQPRVNDFYTTVERLPDVRLTGFRQQIGATPLFYQSESTVGYYEQKFAETNAAQPDVNYEAARADTYHQITLPQTFFGWLNVTPRAGGRFTYYSEASGPGSTTAEATRVVFNTGGEVSFKASRLWPQAQCKALDVDGVRHIVEPSVNYVYVPKPNDTPNELPQFDTILPSLVQLPVEFPEFNSIDSIDKQSVLRFGLNNKLQTKRDGKIDDLIKWSLSTDWQLVRLTNQTTFSDLYSDLAFKPRSWLKLESQTRYDINGGEWRMLLHTLTFEPNNKWSWTLGQFYLKSDLSGSPTALGPGNNIFTSSMFYRVNENWGLRARQHFDAGSGRMQEQYYTIYRDLRSWTAAITGGVRDNGIGPKNYTIAFTFSLKAMPHFGLGSDTVRSYSLLGQ